MHMYRVIQETPRGLPTVIALHGTLAEAEDQAARINVEGSVTFYYHVAPEPVDVSIEYIQGEVG